MKKSDVKETEAGFTKAVIDYAHLKGWKCCHFRAAKVGKKWMTPIQGDPGFPDLVFWRGPGVAVRLIVAELKLKGEKPTVEQYACLAAFAHEMGQAYVWTPDDWPEIERVLGGDVFKSEVKS